MFFQNRFVKNTLGYGLDSLWYFMISYCIYLICYDTLYRYMIVFSGFGQHKCNVEKPLRWMSLQNAYVCQPEFS